ncbi:MAG TPA: MBL fold metallo-hydrolase [Vicinamibacterales bacterium]|jgi:beta-lactamase superfamily II metal-dependent hydrolase|nr:MBL fold metallo-hydrolase [Vicinamibacterales bacterium]
MRKTLISVLLVLLAGVTGATQARKALDVYFVDVEGGQATLVISPSGESMLIDAGYPGFEGRDADRIAAAAKQAGVTRIDYLVVTHYHRDHVGGVPQIAARLPVGTFVDYGANREPGSAAEVYAAYEPVRVKGRHLQPTPGDTLPIKGFTARVVASGGELVKTALREPAATNSLCAQFKPRDPDPTENARSLGLMLEHGQFRMLDLGDLTWNKEHDLVCPYNLLGTVDVYLTTHHGLNSSGPAVVVHAVSPKVVVMNNGATKGGTSEALQIIRSSPGLEDVWQLHYAKNASAAENSAEALIANRDESTAHWIKLSADADGSFVVTNGRNGHSKTYPARR